MTRELKYFILWFFFGLIFAFIFSLHLNFPFLPKKKYEQGFWNYFSRFLIFFVPYFFFLIVRLMLLIIYKLKIIKRKTKPSVIASILFFAFIIGYFGNLFANVRIYANLIKHPLTYEAITPIYNDYRLVTWKRYDHYKSPIWFENDKFVEEVLFFNTDTTATLTRHLIEKNNLFIWKHLFKFYDATYLDTIVAKNDTLFWYYNSEIYDYRKLIFKNDTLRFEPKLKFTM